MSRFPARLLWLTPFLLLAPVYLTGQALFWGTPLLQFIPWWKAAWDALLAGYLPLWNPDVGMGAPLLANYQSALFYPVTWGYFILYLIGGVRWMAWGQALSVALHLAISAVGMARLARRLEMGALAQAVAGLAYGLCGYLVARAGFLSINAAAAWLPWVLLALTVLIDALRRPPGVQPAAPRVARRAFLSLAACLALQLLSGHAQTTWYTLLLAGLWTLFFGWYASGERPAGARLRLCWRILVGFALAGLLAAGIAAVQLLPTAEYLAQSQRSAAVAYDYAMNYSFWPWYLLSLFAPGMFGSPASGDFWGFANYWENAIYVGVLPFFLALSTLRRAFARRARLQAGAPGNEAETGDGNPIARRPVFLRFLWGVVLVSLLFAFGSFTPLYPWLYRHIPTFSLFQAPARWLILTEVALALLAAAGADAWRRPRRSGLYWTRLGAAGALAVALGAGLGWLLLGEVSPSFVRAIALLGLWSLGAALLSLYAPPAAEPDAPVAAGSLEQPGPIARWLGRFWPALARPKTKKPPRRPLLRSAQPYSAALWQSAATAWLALDLLVAGWGLNPGGPLALYDPLPAAQHAHQLAQSGRLYIPAAHEQWLKYTRFLRFETYHIDEDWLNMRAVHLPNANLLDGLAMANQFDPLTPAHYAGWLEMLTQASPAVYAQLVDLMNVGLVETLARHAPNGVRFTPAPPGGRVRFAPCGVWVQDADAAKALMLSGALNFNRQVVLQGQETGPGCSEENPVGGSFQVRIFDEAGPNRLTFAVTANTAGWVWLADVDYPGWRVEVNGEPAPIVRANYAFRAVYLAEPGDYTIRYDYRPYSFLAGALVTLAALVVFIALAWAVRNR